MRLEHASENGKTARAGMEEVRGQEERATRERRERLRANDRTSALLMSATAAGTLDSVAIAQLAEACDVLPLPLPK